MYKNQILIFLNLNELPTTEMELAAMAKAANSGFKIDRAAKGIRITL